MGIDEILLSSLKRWKNSFTVFWPCFNLFPLCALNWFFIFVFTLESLSHWLKYFNNMIEMNATLYFSPFNIFIKIHWNFNRLGFNFKSGIWEVLSSWKILYFTMCLKGFYLISLTLKKPLRFFSNRYCFW